MKQSDRAAQAGPDGAQAAAAGTDKEEDKDKGKADAADKAARLLSLKSIMVPDALPGEDDVPEDAVAKRAGGKGGRNADAQGKDDEFIAEPGALRRRFFIAVMVPEAATRSLAALRAGGAPHWDWKDAGDYHISLAFPGALTQSQTDRLTAVLAQVDHPAFDLQFKGLSTFIREPGRNRAGSLSVLWASPAPDGNSRLLSLHQRIAQAMTDNRFTFGRHDVIPHLTVAKAAMEDNALLESFRRAHDGVQSVPWLCDSFGLYETLERGDPYHPANNNGKGTRYRLVESFPLKRAGG